MRSGAVLFGWCEFLAEYIECDIFINDKKKQLNYPPQLLHDQALGIWILAGLQWAECPHHSGFLTETSYTGN